MESPLYKLMTPKRLNELNDTDNFLLNQSKDYSKSPPFTRPYMPRKLYTSLKPRDTPQLKHKIKPNALPQNYPKFIQDFLDEDIKTNRTRKSKLTPLIESPIRRKPAPKESLSIEIEEPDQSKPPELKYKSYSSGKRKYYSQINRIAYKPLVIHISPRSKAKIYALSPDLSLPHDRRRKFKDFKSYIERLRKKLNSSSDIKLIKSS